MFHNQIMPQLEEVIDNKITLSLKVTEAYTSKDVGRGIARIDHNVMRYLHVSIGDTIEISGKKKATPARCIPLQSALEIVDKYTVGIDRITRYNAMVAIGDTVNVRKINAIAADKITIKPLTATAIAKSSVIDERYLRDALTNIPLKLMDVVIIPYFKLGMAFNIIDVVPFNSTYSDAGLRAFTVTTNTKFEMAY
jgi:hypothetical protein